MSELRRVAVVVGQAMVLPRLWVRRDRPITPLDPSTNRRNTMYDNDPDAARDRFGDAIPAPAKGSTRVTKAPIAESMTALESSIENLESRAGILVDSIRNVLGPERIEGAVAMAVDEKAETSQVAMHVDNLTARIDNVVYLMQSVTARVEL